MAKIGELFPSNYIRATDIPAGRMVRAQIARVDQENMAPEGKPPEFKPVVYFNGKDKGMVLNKTNAEAIAVVLGDETDNWPGATVALYQTPVTFNGQTMPGLRVSVPPQNQRPQPPAADPHQRPAAPAAPPFGDEGTFGEDDIPF